MTNYLKFYVLNFGHIYSISTFFGKNCVEKENSNGNASGDGNLKFL